MAIPFVDGLNTLVIQHAYIQPHIQTLVSMGAVSNALGQSSDGREIVSLRFGQGERRILAWSQMHGDESTATAALIDLAYYLVDEKPEWLENITLLMVPMLNPDGAERESRFNAHGIDINRDALVLQSPEGRILNALVEDFKPDWAFNLHDQDRWYRAGSDGLPATLSFLATAGDEVRTITPARQAAMGLIGQMLDFVPESLEIGIGRYSDEYNGRCFGDTIAAQDIPVILIESGHKENDPTRQTARRLNASMLLNAFEIIAQSNVSNDIERYHQLPMNQENGCADLLIKNPKLSEDTVVDVVVRGDKVDPDKVAGTIKDIGDYQHLYAYSSIDASGYQLTSVLTYHVDSPLHLEDDVYLDLLNQGYLRFSGNPELLKNSSSWPIDWENNQNQSTTDIAREQSATFALTQDNKVKIAVICGHIIELT